MAARSVQFTDKGARAVNQDAVFSYEGEKVSLYAVADGMGGHLFGERASGAVVEALQELTVSPEWKALELQERPDALGQAVERSLQKANERVFREDNQGSHICGTTVVVLLLASNTLRAFSIGDSHIYSFDRQQMQTISQDDLWENDRARTGEMTESEIEESPLKGRLVRALGIDENMELHRYAQALTGDMAFLLCSDGVYKYAGEAGIRKAMEDVLLRTPPEEAIQPLLEEAAQKTDDNYSAVLVRFHLEKEKKVPQADTTQLYEREAVREGAKTTVRQEEAESRSPVQEAEADRKHSMLPVILSAAALLAAVLVFLWLKLR